MFLLASGGAEVLDFFKNFIGTPAILVGIFGMIGSMLQKKSVSQVLVATFKTIIGFLILGGGGTIISASLVGFNNLFSGIFGLQGIIPNNDVLGAYFVNKMPTIASVGSAIMIVGMIANIILAKVTQFKYIFLSGHVMFYMSIMLAVVFDQSGMDMSKDMWMAIIAGGLFMGMYMIISPMMCQRYIRFITKSDNVAQAHTGGLAYAVSGLIGEAILKFSGKEKLKSTEDINFPKGLAFLRNTNISVALTMLIIYLVLYIAGWAVLGKQAFIDFGIIHSDSDSIIVALIVNAFTFAAGMDVILFGVRTILGELIPAFKGVSEKLVRNAKPALDCPIVYPYAPNAVFIGFISSFVGGVVGMAITIGIADNVPIVAVILPGITAHFFTGATSGVYGNVRGGIWGAVVGSFVNGLIITFVPVVFWVGQWVPTDQPLVWGDADYLFGIIPGLFNFIGDKDLAKWLVFGLFIVLYVGFLVNGFFYWFFDHKKHPEKYIKPAKVIKKDAKSVK